MSSWLERARAACAEPEPKATKAAEWLLDNDYQVQRAVLQVEQDLPAEFYGRLPRLMGPDDEGLPRAFSLAHGLLDASRLQLSLTAAINFVNAYQGGSRLTIAELWAFPTMLRLACLEILVAAFGRLLPELQSPFDLTEAAAAMTSLENTECVSRALANLGVVASIPWKFFFDRTSHVEALLEADPTGIYRRMDFATRDRYRKAIEELARGSGRSESDVAEDVLARAQAANDGRPRDYVGFWLFGDGHAALESALGYRISASTACGRWLLRHAGPLYAIALSTASILALVLPALHLTRAATSAPIWALGIVVTLIPASILAVTLVNWIITLVVPPRLLPKLDFENGIPPDCATAVVMPVLVGSPEEVPELLERLEAHRLANPDPSLRFVLLSDYADAPQEEMPEDASLAQSLVNGIRQLNSRVTMDGIGPFHVLHRPRRHNPSEGRWMGWERKRGKLEQFNDLVMSGDASHFSVREGNQDGLRGIRFVVTVDADTTLPPGSIRRLVGTLSHPLNSPEFDLETGRLLSGYTIVQPRVEISPESASCSLFARLYTGDTAIDIYTRAVSDVYQDLFGSGTYVGKGIYEVASFRRSLEGRVPDNTILSHDLFEGAHGRVALASDIVVYEGFPGGYLEYARRWHRWVRGDWQLLPWMRRQVPGRSGRRQWSQLSGLDRWRIFDNLRRSLIPPALVAFAAFGWLVLPAHAWTWTILTAAAPAAYLFTDLVTGMAHGRRRGSVRGIVRRLIDPSGRWFLAVVFLVHDAAVAVDAILRTLWRMLVSRRNLIEWTSAAHTATRLAARNSRLDLWRHMWVAPTLSIALAGTLVSISPAAFVAATPLLLLWLTSPEIALQINRPRRPVEEHVGADDRAFLQRLARRTWLYFETFVGPDDNWLPPDNFQEDPHKGVAHRTSPTNIGMMFLSSLTARDLGYAGLTDFIARIRNGLDSLDRLDRHRGHFFNWYDTQRLDPLEPRYVSTVDSGNLAVSLIALKEGCLEAATGPTLRPEVWDGLRITVELLTEATDHISGEEPSEVRSWLAAIAKRVWDVRQNPRQWRTTLIDLCERQYPQLERMIVKAVSSPGGPRPETLRKVQIWLERMHHHLLAMQRDFEALAPWLALTDAPPPGCEELARRIRDNLGPPSSLADAADRFTDARQTMAEVLAQRGGDAEAAQWISDLDAAIASGSQHRSELQAALFDLAKRAEAMAYAMDFRLLFDRETLLFHIGYNVTSHHMDANHYDLLATEARLASFFAIAKGDVPIEHWFVLGRPVTHIARGLALISWSGSAFEYLMPLLLLPSSPDTLLGESERTAVDAQRRFADRLGIPWGISESAYALYDSDQNYRYRAFGVPGLGLRRGLSRDAVVAPYATALALPVRPAAAVVNLRELDRLGLAGHFGLFDAADFTPERVAAGGRFSAVRTYMAHHQGMILAAIGNALCENVLVRRFRADGRMRVMDLLLQERVPWELPTEISRLEEQDEVAPSRTAVPVLQAWEPPASAAFPQVHALGNGRLVSWISDAGAGALRWHQHALTRWVPDATCDDHGLWIYVRDEDSGSLWSIGRQPTGIIPEDARVIFHPHMAEFHRRDHGVAIRMDVGVTPGDDIEIRRITLNNDSDRPRTLSLTSYAEVVLAPPLEDERHPAFSKLFVGSEHLPEKNGLLYRRRPRHPREQPPVLLHRVVTDELDLEVTGLDADRRAFLGRNGDPRRPRGVVEGLSGTVGWTLDPIMALQVRLELEPQEERQLAFLTLASGSRESVLEIAERYATLASLNWAFTDAAADAAQEAHRLELEPERLPEFQMLGSLLLQPHPALRADPAVIAANRLGQSRLWGLGLSGDLPILLLRMHDPRETELLRRLIRGHLLWRRRRMNVDLVVIRTSESGYEEPVRERVLALLREAGAQQLLGQTGGVHLFFADQIGEEDVRLLESVARVLLDVSRGSLAQQLAGIAETRTRLPPFEPTGTHPPEEPIPAIVRPAELRFENGFGGFSEDGREYVIHLRPGESTPSPWSNVIANDEFGCLVTESGGGFTWAVNSGENRLTPWTNDPIADPPDEALYLRDEESAEIWTPTPQPTGAETAHQIRHGAGYTTWKQRSHGLEQELLVFVPRDDPVKITRLRLRNLRPRARRVTATYYAEWLLGSLRSSARAFVVCEYEATSRALLARNPWNADFAERVAFLTSSLPPHDLTTDRQEFLGRDGDLRRPAALRRWGLGGRVQPGADPCAALQVHVDIGPQETTDVVFIFGQGRDRAQALELARRWQEPAEVDRALEALNRHWDQQLGAVQVHTPDPAFDLMVNRWLLYQTVASRIQARAGFYQAGGAIGFRDQLQDVLALLWSDSARVRAHILVCAAKQFEQGDVLHWWHPPNDRGVRTRCSDDLIWLVYATGCYVEATGDDSILREEVTFLRAPPLSPEEEDRYARFDPTPERRSLFEHCERALEHGVTRGQLGLPLIGSGDWNDGMNRVGRQGRGQSVWLAWFMIATMESFTRLCARLGRNDLADRWTSRARELRRAVDEAGWDGQWYVRAFDDDGRPWGSATSDECRIDSVAQSWAVLAGTEIPARARIALDAATKELIRDDDGLIRLLWPPFDETPRDPGYIKAYPPGIRENGGQYTHAAAWLGLAFAGLGDGDQASRVFDMLNPIRHSSNRADCERYRVEPYVIAADIASVAPHVARGGWTWYTGSAAWAWRLAIEGILGLRLRNGQLLIDPCLPRSWGGFGAEIRGPAGALAIRVEDPDHIGRGSAEIIVDGLQIEGAMVALPTNGSMLRIVVRLRRPPAAGIPNANAGRAASVPGVV